MKLYKIDRPYMEYLYKADSKVLIYTVEIIKENLLL